MAKPRAIGIDLGTTNSAAAWVDESGHTAMIPNTEGDLLTPSVVLFDDTEVIVGKEARNATAVDPERVAIWVKRDMGAPIYSRPIRGPRRPSNRSFPAPGRTSARCWNPISANSGRQ